MTGPAVKAPWVLARLAQGAIAATAVAEVFREVAVRAHGLHPAAASASRSGWASMVFVYLMTTAVAAFLTWFSHCRRNAQALSPDSVTGSGARAVAAWLIPVVNLWVPRRLVLDVRRASSPGVPGIGRDEILVNTWWAAWAGHMVVVELGQAVRGTSMVLLVVSGALIVAAAVLAVCVIQRVTTVQSAALQVAAPAGPLVPA